MPEINILYLIIYNNTASGYIRLSLYMTPIAFDTFF